jgi:ribosomal protein L40E
MSPSESRSNACRVCPECGYRNGPAATHCSGCSGELRARPETTVPAYGAAPSARPDAAVKTPAVVEWYRLYCGALLVLYLFVVPVLVFMATEPPQDGPFTIGAPSGSSDIDRIMQEANRGFKSDQDNRVATARILGIGLCLLLAAPIGIALRMKPTPGAWRYHIAILALGLTGGCTLPVSVIMLILWFQPNTQAYFGRAPNPSLAA